MSIVGIVGAVGPLSKLLLKVLEVTDPKTRDWVRRRKALEWGEKYILKNRQLIAILYADKLTKKDRRKIKALIRRLNWYEKQFHLND